MAALAADRAGVAGEPLVKATLATLTARARSALAQPAELRVAGDGYYSYPLRRAGLTAILGHAASLGEVDVAVARRRLFEALSESSSSLSTFERSTALLHSLWLVERDAKAMKTLPAPRVTGEGGEVPPLEVRGSGPPGPPAGQREGGQGRRLRRPGRAPGPGPGAARVGEAGGRGHVRSSGATTGSCPAARGSRSAPATP